MFPINVYTGGVVENGQMGSTYSKPPAFTYPAQDSMTFDELRQLIFRQTGINEEKNNLSISARWNAGTAGPYWFVLMPITDENVWRMIVDNTISGYTKWNMVELFVDSIPKGASLGTTPTKTAVPCVPDIQPGPSQCSNQFTPVRSKRVKKNSRREVKKTKRFDFVGANVANDSGKDNSGEEEDEEWQGEGEESDEDEDDLPLDFELPKYSARRSRDPPAPFFKDVPDMQSATADCQFSDGKGRPPEPVDASLYVGRLFSSLDHLKWVVLDYHIRENRMVVTDRASTKIYVLKCEQWPNCRWRLSAVPTGDGVSFRIRFIRGPHSCSNEEVRKDHRNLSSNFIAQMIRNMVREKLDTSPKDIQESVKKRYPFTLSYNKAWLAKQKAIAHLFGEWRESYTLLAPLFNAIQASNPGTKVNWWSDSTADPKVRLLRGVSWAFGPAIKGFSHCRPVIGIDSAILSGKYGGKLLFVVAYDGEGQLLPLAFSIVETENDESWYWFMYWLRKEVVGTRPLCVISDRQDYILRLFDQPDSGWCTGTGEAFHRYCSRYLCESFQAVFKKEELVDLVKWALKQNQPSKFQLGMTHILQANREAYNWLMKVGTKPFEESAYHVWTQCEDGGRRYGIMTTNGPECLNTIFKGICELPITAMVELTFHKSAKYFAERKEAASKIQIDNQLWSNKITAILGLRKDKASKHEITGYHFGTSIHEVKTKIEMVNSRQKGGVKHVVRLDQRSCDCQKPQLTGIPCSHMLAICAFGSFDISQFVDEAYSVGRLLATWVLQLHAFGSSEDWPEYTGIVYEPNGHNKKRGRRKRGKGSLGPVNRCSMCGQIGHNKKRCQRKIDYEGTSTSHTDVTEEGQVDIGLIQEG
ncbi:MuDR family transposase [Rhynchospora pubera]|uniref:MuDR family transposase n=1 Tax=Rhynchospora pubera TaxID=906938 RepID=A0AAV8H3Y8_9POAL|nr:MuDR family transposase [Rhynchospora pubera]